MTYEAQPATLSDVGWIEQTVAAAYEPYVSRIGRMPAPMTEDYCRLVEKREVRIAKDGRSRVGLIVARQHGDAWFVDNVAVPPDRQGRGVGRFLLEDAANQGTEAGCAVLRLYTNEAMTENLTFYPAIGFREVERREEEGFRRVYFERPITPS